MDLEGTIGNLGDFIVDEDNSTERLKHARKLCLLNFLQLDYELDARGEADDLKSIEEIAKVGNDKGITLTHEDKEYEIRVEDVEKCEISLDYKVAD
ncbi:hypothetical protein KGY79_13450 [Candidatus Bipolaricaulota bacterium]|nr:hypothetical protein [Candidatus Bipolaricaulota bacterium]